jgi:uncharacterized membrane protein YccC
MEPQSEALNDGRWNYFNYFTEVEEHFQRARGTGLFLMSPLDWALVEQWKNGGVPLEAVLRGIDHAFEKHYSKKSSKGNRQINSVAWCAQAVQEEAQAMAGNVVVRREPVKAPFELEELQNYLRANINALARSPENDEVTAALERILDQAAEHYTDLEQLEQRLTALEEKLSAIARARVSDEELFQHRRELESTLRPYRSRMSAEQIAMLERQYLDRRIQEKAGLPRLSLFYLK